MDPPLRETMLVRGDVDAITGFSFTSLLNLEARGVKADDVVVLPYPDYGVKLYGNAIIVVRGVPQEEPGGGEGLPARLHQGHEGRDRRSEGERSRRSRQRDGIINEALELRRLKLALDATVLTPDARGRRLRQRARAAPGADGEPGLRRLRHQGPGQAASGVERQLPADAPPSATSSPSREEVTAEPARRVPLRCSSTSTRSGSPTTTSCWRRTSSRSRTSRSRSTQGEFIAIVGPSGCGKSTFMKLATGLTPAEPRPIRIDGAPVTGPLKISGMAFQAPSLLPWRSTVDNVLLPLEIVEPHRSQFKQRRAEYAAARAQAAAERRPRRLRGQVPVAALGRHAAARLDLPRADPRAQDAAARRALRRARRLHARGAVVHAARPVDGAAASTSSWSRTTCARRCSWPTRCT